MRVGNEQEPGRVGHAGTIPRTADTSDRRDTVDRSLDRAQQRDRAWREREVTRAQRANRRMLRLEGRVGLMAAPASLLLLVAGFLIALTTGATFLLLGTAAVALSGAAVLATGRRLREGIRRHLSHLGVYLAERGRERRQP